MQKQQKIIAFLAAFSFFLGLSTNLQADNLTNNNPTSNNTEIANIPPPQAIPQQDPYEGYNRKIYHFNKNVDCYILKPTAQLYKKILPWPVTRAISNFFCNINNIPSIINDILQGNLYYTLHDTTRLVINSVFGIGGLIDVASYGNLQQHNNDFGLTLARWGYRCSSYFIVPIIGPCTVRDTIALPVDYGAFSPYFYAFPLLGAGYIIQYSVGGVYAIDKRAQYLDFDQVMKEAAVDPYVFERDAYLQHRDAEIASNNNMDNSKDAKDPYTADVAADVGSATPTNNSETNSQSNRTKKSIGLFHLETPSATPAAATTQQSHHADKNIGLFDRETPA